MAEAIVDVVVYEPVDLSVESKRSVSIAASAVQEDEIGVDVFIDHSTPSIPPYAGPYEVIPTLDGETLQTKNKYMAKDLTVQPIPYFEVSNASGGETVYIAGEIEFE